MTSDIKKGPFLGQRHLQTFLLFLSIVVNYMAKFNASVAVVAMTNSETSNPNFPEYDWNEMERSYILSSFFWGYMLTQFLGGWLGRLFGCKTTMLISTLGSATLVLLPPFLVPWGGWQVFCAIRGCMGLFQGLLFPCIHAHLASWSPVSERNRLGALANSGIDFGVLMAMFISGRVAASSLGWPGIFYVSCGVGYFWCVLWWFFSANTPRESKWISKAELNYIESSKKAIAKLENVKEQSNIPVPWLAIWTSVPLWALVTARCSYSWGYSTLQAEIPAYMNGVLLMDMKSNAFYSALPYFTSWVMSYVFLIASDILLTTGCVSLTAIRKGCNTIALWVPAAGLIAVGFVGSDEKALVIILMTVNVGVISGSTIGSAINTIDLSPNHAGILMGIVNTGVNIVPVLTPLIVGFVVKDEHNRGQWQIVFILSSVIFFFGNLVYLIWGRMVLQPWDDEHYLSQKKKDPEECCNKSSIEEISY